MLQLLEAGKRLLLLSGAVHSVAMNMLLKDEEPRAGNVVPWLIQGALSAAVAQGLGTHSIAALKDKLVKGLKFDGESLMKLVDGRKESFESSFYITECTWMRKHGWLTPEWKLIVALEPDFHFKPEIELYNLVRDPDELDNVADAHPDIVATLRARLETHVFRREQETGNANPMLTQGDWHGIKGVGPFKSSQQAYDTLHIGDPKQARRLQAGKKKKDKKKTKKKTSRSKPGKKPGKKSGKAGTGKKKTNR